jgi:hypothetical protein
MIGAGEHIARKARTDESGKITHPGAVLGQKALKAFKVAGLEQPTLTGMTNLLSIATGESAEYIIQNQIRTMSSVFNPGITRNLFIKGVTDHEAVNKRGMDFYDRWLNDMYQNNVLFHYGDKWLGDEDAAYATPDMIAWDKNKVQKMNLPHLNLRGQIADPTQSPALQWLSANIDVFNSNKSEATPLDVEMAKVMRELPDDYEGRRVYSDPKDKVQWEGLDKKIKVQLMRGDHWEMVREARRRKALELDYMIRQDWYKKLTPEEKADEWKIINSRVNTEMRQEMVWMLEDLDYTGGIEKKAGPWKGDGMEYKYR